jgi:hypothetical protein
MIAEFASVDEAFNLTILQSTFFVFKLLELIKYVLPLDF